MELGPVRDTLEHASKKQKVSETTTEDVVSRMAQEIEIAVEKLTNPSHSLGSETKTVIAELQASLSAFGPLTQVGMTQKELNSALNKYGKALDRFFQTDIGKVCRDVDFDLNVINKIIALHFYQQGRFDLGDCFVEEAKDSCAILRAPFYEMYEILRHIKSGNLELALAWAKSHHDELLQKGSSLEFNLHQLQFVNLLQQGLQPQALHYARTNLSPFAALHMEKIQRLMGSLLWAGRLETSPYSDLSPPEVWEFMCLEFTRECCNLLGQSYESALQVTISAGAQALPMLLKLVALLSTKNQDWLGLKQLPVEIELDKEFQFHSVFACPVSKEQSTAENPPMLMPCGHVLCKQSLQRLSKSRSFKCPYCPVELVMNQCKPIIF